MLATALENRIYSQVDVWASGEHVTGALSKQACVSLQYTVLLNTCQLPGV